MIHSVRSFSETYLIDRKRLTRLIDTALRAHSGVFALEGYGYFRASRPGPTSPLEIETYYPTAHEQEEIAPVPVRGDSHPIRPQPPASDSPQPDQTVNSIASSSSASSALAAPTLTEHELKLRVLEERAVQLKQKNILEQAKLREETVSYCSQVIQLLLSSLRSDLAALQLDPAAVTLIRRSLDSTLSDLKSILPDIIAGVSPDQIELALSARRAARLAEERASFSLHPRPETTTPKHVQSSTTDTANDTANERPAEHGLA